MRERLFIPKTTLGLPHGRLLTFYDISCLLESQVALKIKHSQEEQAMLNDISFEKSPCGQMLYAGMGRFFVNAN